VTSRGSSLLFASMIMLILTFLARDIALNTVGYRYELLVTIENLSSKTQLLPREAKMILPPDIPGWQRVATINVEVNGTPTDYVISYDYDRNVLISPITPSKILPHSQVSIKYEVVIKVARNSFFIRKKPMHIDEIDYIKDPKRELIRPLGEWDWSKNNDHKWKRLKDLAMALKGSNDLETVFNVAEWVVNNIKYVETETVLPPHTVYEKRIGDCADQSTFIVTLLRMLGIPSLIALGLVYSPLADYSVHEYHLGLIRKGFNLHAFVLAYVNNIGWIPIDTTAYIGKDNHAFTKGALIVSTDRVIIGGFIIGSNPNEYETFKAYNSLKLNVKISIKRELDFSLFLVIGEALFVIVLLLKRIFA